MEVAHCSSATGQCQFEVWSFFFELNNSRCYWEASLVMSERMGLLICYPPEHMGNLHLSSLLYLVHDDINFQDVANSEGIQYKLTWIRKNFFLVYNVGPPPFTPSKSDKTHFIIKQVVYEEYKFYNWSFKVWWCLCLWIVILGRLCSDKSKLFLQVVSAEFWTNWFPIGRYISDMWH